MRLPDRRRFLHDTAALAAALVANPANSAHAGGETRSGAHRVRRQGSESPMKSFGSG